MSRKQTKKEALKEFDRWLKLDNKDDSIWFRSVNQKGWNLINHCSWEIDKFIYAVSDEYAEYKKAFYDGRTVQKSSVVTGKWRTIKSILEIKNDYIFRIKPSEWYEELENKGKIVFVRDDEDKYWKIDVFTGYVDGAGFPFTCQNDCYKYAKLATYTELIEKGYLG